MDGDNLKATDEAPIEGTIPFELNRLNAVLDMLQQRWEYHESRLGPILQPEARLGESGKAETARISGPPRSVVSEELHKFSERGERLRAQIQATDDRLNL